MRIDALTVEGLRHAPNHSDRGLGRSCALPQAPRGMAVADGIALLVAALDPVRAEWILQRTGLAGEQTELFLDEAELPEQVTSLRAEEVEAMLDPEGGRKVVVEATMALDPPLFGRLREESMRDPRMLAALGAEPVVRLKVGWLFTTDFAAASVGVLEVRVADVSFPTGRVERPRWMDAVLRAVGAKIGGVGGPDDGGDLGAHLLDAALSPDAEVRVRYGRLAEAMAEAPFGFGRLELVGTEHGILPCFGPDLVRARQHGPRARLALRVAAAALVDAPDVLVVQHELDPDWVAWLETLTEGDDATLEQVFWLPGRPV